MNSADNQPGSIEKPGVEAPEISPMAKQETESVPERESAGAEASAETERSAEPRPAEPALQVAAAAVPASEAARDPLLIEVENKLSEGLWDAYKSMDPGLRARFKAEGERIAAVARDGISSGKLAAERLLDMIVKWLRMIPRVDRWFLIQDAKLKTDALIRMSRRGVDHQQ